MCVIWDVRDVGCSGCGMCRMWDVRDVGCSECGMFGMWDVGCGIFAGMWDVDLQNAWWYSRVIPEKITWNQFRANISAVYSKILPIIIFC